MVARKDQYFSDVPTDKTYFDLLESELLKIRPSRTIFRFNAQRKTVRSVQRFILPNGKDAEWVKTEYVTWLPKILSLFIGVKYDGSSVVYSLHYFEIKLLELKQNIDRSNNDRQLLYITDGLLVSGANGGRLEFRVVLNRQFVLAAIHDYNPSLPWFIYKYSQALVHLLVMRGFGQHLAVKAARETI